MVDFFMLPAEYGDCLWMELDDDGKHVRVLVDCGTPSSWSYLKARIEKLERADRHFDLLVISHIDNDHIGGAIPLLRERHELGVSFGEIWFNGARHLAPDTLGVEDGNKLTGLLEAPDLKDRWNRSFGGNAVCVPVDGTLPSHTFGPLTLTLLSPLPSQLNRLAANWQVECKLAGLDSADEVGQSNTPMPEPDDVLGADIDMPILLALRSRPDNAAANGSSIAVLARVGNWCALLGADAFPATLVSTLDRLEARGPIRLDLFKLPHHGSKANITDALLSKIECAHFLVSSNGKKFRHPDPEAIARIVSIPGNKTLHFNYRSDQTIPWANPDLMRAYAFATRFVCDSDYRVSTP